MLTHLEPFESRVLLLPPPLVGAHVQVREGHLEDCVCNSELVVLGDSHNVHVPHQHQSEGDDNADEDMDEWIDYRGGVLRQASRVARQELDGGGADVEERGGRGGEDEDPREEEE